MTAGKVNTRSGLAVLIGAAMTLAACAGPSTTVGESSSGVIDHAVISYPSASQSALDPAKAVVPVDLEVLDLINGKLFQTDAKGAVQPDLALSATPSDDLTTWTVKLRPGQKFSDGSDLTSKDVVATFLREKSVPGNVVSAFTNPLKTVTAPDDTTAVFTFSQPFPDFEGYTSTGVYGCVYPAGKVGDPASFKNPVTAGRYKVASPWTGGKIQLTVNPNYWAGRPQITNLTVETITDPNSAISQLQSGQVNFAANLPSTYVSRLDGTSGVTVGKVEAYGFFDIRMNNAKGPLSDINLRKAISAAIDRPALVSAIFGDKDTPTSGFWPAQMAGHNPSAPTAVDLAAAKKYLAASAYPNGTNLTLMYSDQDMPFESQAALLVQSQLQKIGITLTMQSVDVSTLVSHLTAGTYDLNLGANAALGNIPGRLAEAALQGGGSINAEFTGYDSAPMKALIAKLSASSGAEAKNYQDQIEQQFTQDAPFAVWAPRIQLVASTLPQNAFMLTGAGSVVGMLAK